MNPLSQRLTKEYLEANVQVATVPSSSRLLAALAGIPILENEHLRYDEMYIGQGAAGLVVGEVRHLLYRMKMLDLDAECRDAAAAHIEATARRVLGEDWKLPPK